MKLQLLIATALIVLLPSFAQADDDPVSYNKDVRRILSNRCFKCHGPDDRARKRRPQLDNMQGATKPARSGERPIVPGEPETSELIRRISSTDPDYRMPPPSQGDALSPEDIATLRAWIAQGANYERHWSYVPPTRPDVPAFRNAWVTNPIDAFVLRRLQHEGLGPSPEADRYALMRRVYLDLIGLPPTPEQIKRFMSKKGPRAYEKLVDELLESPRYGEHWARMWLDYARYADTKGYEKDDHRTMWPYRDWVIKALNDDMPYDEFTIAQLAGDLLPDADDSLRIATAFHRNTMTNDEGGTDDEEFRRAAIVDRVNTTYQTWMATTINCAECHTHKYDPISQPEFYQSYAFFNQSADNDQPNEHPVLSLATPDQQIRLDHLSARVDKAESAFEALDESTDEAVRKNEKEAFENLKRQRRDYDNEIPYIPIMEELPADQQRETHIHVRGNFLNPGDAVEPKTPDTFNEFKSEWPRNRLGFAYWLTDPANPLTARVAVNRHWEAIFGTGLVKTSEEFGTQGDLPTHPDLLDWLAVEFVESGWSLKDLCRVIVTSSTYRQSSRVTPDLLEKDANNTLLARGPRIRLHAETIRDAALSVAGLLSDKMYGPSVMPPQPDGIWNVVYSNKKWEVSEGEDKYRRGLYTFIRRTSPYPSMMTFDGVSREFCSVQRIRTNTPLQSLVLLNDPVYVEAAQSLGRQMAFADLESNSEKAAYGFIRAIGRPARDAELDRLVKLFENELAHFQSNKEATVQIATQPIGPLWRGDFHEVAAWTVVANVLLNLDEFVMKT